MTRVEAVLSRYEIDGLSTDRRVALRLLALANEPKASVDELTRVLSTEPTLTARLIAYANTSVRGTREPVTSLPPVVSMLGPNAVRSFAATAALELFGSEAIHPPDGLWLHSLTTAIIAADTAHEHGVAPADALTAALLCDIGMSLLYLRNPQSFDELSDTAYTASVEDRLTNERLSFGLDHAALGAQALTELGVPKVIADVVRGHHDETAGTPLARCVQAAVAIAHAIERSSTENSTTELTASLRAVGITSRARLALVDRTIARRRAVITFLATGLTARRTKK